MNSSSVFSPMENSNIFQLFYIQLLEICLRDLTIIMSSMTNSQLLKRKGKHFKKSHMCWVKEEKCVKEEKWGIENTLGNFRKYLLFFVFVLVMRSDDSIMIKAFNFLN